MMCKINHRWRDMKTCNQLFKYKNTFPSPKFPSDGAVLRRSLGFKNWGVFRISRVYINAGLADEVVFTFPSSFSLFHLFFSHSVSYIFISYLLSKYVSPTW